MASALTLASTACLAAWICATNVRRAGSKDSTKRKRPRCFRNVAFIYVGDDGVYPVFAEAPSEAEGEAEWDPTHFRWVAPSFSRTLREGGDFDFLFNKISRIPTLRQHRAKGWGNLLRCFYEHGQFSFGFSELAVYERW
jgi:hypothetical protein